jgi:molybdate transport system substrate-binding protein
MNRERKPNFAICIVLKRLIVTLALCTLFVPGALFAQAPPNSKFFPPWEGPSANDVEDHGLEFTVPEVDNLPDFHGNPINPKLALFVGGNYFFAMGPLVETFERLHPEFKGRIYYETIPPGRLATQIERGGTITVGNMTWTVQADAYFAGLRGVKRLVEKGLLEEPIVPYVTNQLAIMVPKGNPAHVSGLTDLARPGLRLVMPNPEYEGIARQIQAALRKAGGDTLEKIVYEQKVRDGSTILTAIHHRQTPLDLMLGRADAGVTWQSEVIFEEQVGNPISMVPIPSEQNVTAVYAGAVVKKAQHPEAAKLWLNYIRSQEAMAIFSRYGFKPYKEQKKAEP